MEALLRRELVLELLNRFESNEFITFYFASLVKKRLTKTALGTTTALLFYLLPASSERKHCDIKVWRAMMQA